MHVLDTSKARKRSTYLSDLDEYQMSVDKRTVENSIYCSIYRFMGNVTLNASNALSQLYN